MPFSKVAHRLTYRMLCFKYVLSDIARGFVILNSSRALILSPREKGTGGAIELKQKLLKEHPDKYIDLDQFKDPANILAHYQTARARYFYY